MGHSSGLLGVKQEAPRRHRPAGERRRRGNPRPGTGRCSNKGRLCWDGAGQTGVGSCHNRRGISVGSGSTTAPRSRGFDQRPDQQRPQRQRCRFLRAADRFVSIPCGAKPEQKRRTKAGVEQFDLEHPNEACLYYRFAFLPKAQSKIGVDTYTRHGLHPGCGRLCRRQAAVRGKRGEEGFGSREGRGLHRQDITRKEGGLSGGDGRGWRGVRMLLQARSCSWVGDLHARLEKLALERPRVPIAVSNCTGI